LSIEMRSVCWIPKPIVYEGQESEAYSNFINSLDSEITKNGYRRGLNQFMQFLHLQYYSDLLKIDPTKLEGVIRDYILYMRQNHKLSPSTVSVRTAAISHFYEMNDIELKWKKLKRFKGKFRIIVEDRSYTRD
jgi:site-specific recombinase XerD